MTISPTVTYSKRVVGFVDILGFGQLVQRADSDAGLRAGIIDALHRVRQVAAPAGGSETDLRAQNFSDSLIISAAASPEGLWHVLLSLDALAWNLLHLGILVRGGVTIGGAHHDDEVVFGLGINDAYRLELTVARGPRIILGRPAMAAARAFAAQNEVWATYQDSRLRRDVDGVWYLNILTELGCFSRQARSEGVETHPFFSDGEELRRSLQNMIDSTVDQPEVYAKIEWFARYWNAEVATPPPGMTDTLVGPVLLAGQEARGPTLPFRAHGGD